MNLFTRNSPYYHLLKYLLFFLKHPVYIFTILPETPCIFPLPAHFLSQYRSFIFCCQFPSTSTSTHTRHTKHDAIHVNSCYTDKIRIWAADKCLALLPHLTWNTGNGRTGNTRKQTVNLMQQTTKNFNMIFCPAFSWHLKNKTLLFG